MFALLAALSVGPAAQAVQQQQQTEELWSRLLHERRLAQEATASLRAEFHLDYRSGPEAQPEHVQEKDCEFAIEGGKLYYRDSVLVAGKQFSHLAAFNGTTARVRKSNAPDVLLMTQNKSYPVFRSSLPHQTIEYIHPSKLEARRKEGTAAILSAEEEVLDGSRCLKVVFTLGAGPAPHRVEAWYDAENSYLPRLTKAFAPDGSLQTLIDGVQFASAVVDGNRYAFPIAGRSNSFEKGVSVLDMSFSVKEGSIKFNSDVPDDLFELTPLPTERIYNADAGVFVSEPGKVVDMEEALGPIPGAPGSGGTGGAAVAAAEPASESAGAPDSARTLADVPLSPGTGTHPLLLPVLLATALLLLGAGIFFWRRGSRPQP